METFTLSSATESAEILLVMIVSLIGASIHEYIFRSNTVRGGDFLRSPKVWISAFVSSSPILSRKIFASFMCFVLRLFII